MKFTKRWNKTFGDREFRTDYDEFLVRVRERHTEKSSDGGVILAEILDGKDEKDRNLAAFVYGYLGYKRGWKSLERLARKIEPTIVPSPDDTYPRGRQFYYELLMLFGYLDLPESHRFLVRVLNEGCDSWIKCGAVDGMAYEKKRFEVKLILPFLSLDCHPHLIQCTLYALMYHGYFWRRRAELENMMSTLLRHPDPGVRCYVIMVIESLYSEKNRSVLIGLLDDDSERVRQEAQAALLSLDWYLESVKKAKREGWGR